MFGNDFKIFRGLNGRQVAIKSNVITHIEEHELDGKLAANVNFQNGKWSTVGNSLEECLGILAQKEESEEEENRTKKQHERWKEQAMDRKKMDIEIDAIKDVIFRDTKKKIQGWCKEEKGSVTNYIITVLNESEDN